MTATQIWDPAAPLAAPVRLVVSDMDGTLLTDQGTIPMSFWPVLARMHDLGITFAAASGRQRQTLEQLFGGSHAGISYIADNGACITHEGHTEVAASLAPAVIDHILARTHLDSWQNAGVVLSTEGAAYIDRDDDAFIAEIRKYYTELRLVPDLADLNFSAIKLAVFSFDGADSILPALDSVPDSARTVVSGKQWVDITDPSVHKGVAVARLQRMLGVTPTETVAFGDYLNDLEMLRSAGHSFAMANAHPDVIGVAKRIAPSNSERGVVSVLTHLLDERDAVFAPERRAKCGLRWIQPDDEGREVARMTSSTSGDQDAHGRVSPRASRPTIQDVAERAGVTKSTVSKYLNAESNNYYVSAATRERIEAAIDSLHFEPSLIAQGLTQNRTMTIGLIAADIRNPFYPDLVAGVQDVVEDAGYTLLLGNSNSDSRREMAIARSMIRRQVDGVILGSARMEAQDIQSLMASGMRFVLASRDLPDLVTDSVTVDNTAGAELAVEHLVELGHRRIAHVAGPQDIVPFWKRLSGFRHALTKHDIALNDSYVLIADSSTAEAGAKAARTLLARSDRPTAIFLSNDNMALGAMDAARQLELRIPEDVSIVGFDNIALAANSFIALTTVDSRANQLGTEAATLLLERMSAGEVPPYDRIRTIVRRPILRARGTTGPAPD